MFNSNRYNSQNPNSPRQITNSFDQDSQRHSNQNYVLNDQPQNYKQLPKVLNQNACQNQKNIKFNNCQNNHFQRNQSNVVRPQSQLIFFQNQHRRTRQHMTHVIQRQNIIFNF